MGLLACGEADVRRLPGRLVGETVDRDRFAEVLCELARLAEEDPSRLKEAPVAAPVRRAGRGPGRAQPHPALAAGRERLNAEARPGAGEMDIPTGCRPDSTGGGTRGQSLRPSARLLYGIGW